MLANHAGTKGKIGTNAHAVNFISTRTTKATHCLMVKNTAILVPSGRMTTLLSMTRLSAESAGILKNGKELMMNALRNAQNAR